MKFKIILILFYIGIHLQVYSQEFKIIKSFVPVKDSVIGIYFIPSDEEVVRLTSSKPISKGIAKSGSLYEGYEMFTFEQSLVFSDGFVIPLGNDESLIDIKGNIILTEQRIIENEGSKIIRIYNLLGKKINFIAQTKMEIDNQVFLLNNGNVLVNDEFEGYGQSIQFLDSKLNKIHTYKPFNEGRFVSFAFSENGGKLVFSFKQAMSNDERGNLLINIFDSNLGQVINRFETSIDSIKPSNIIFSNESIVLWGDRQLIKLNFEGKVVWSKTINLPSCKMKLIDNDTQILAEVNNGIKVYSINNGQELWNSSFLELSLLNASLELSNSFIKLLEMQEVNNSQVVTLLGIYVKEDVNETIASFRCLILLYDLKGALLQQKILSTKSQLLKVIKVESKIFIVDKNSILSYKKD